MKKLHQSLSYQIHHRFSRLFSFLAGSIKGREEKIVTFSKIAAAEYVEDVFKKARRDCDANQRKYISIVQQNLKDYVQSYIYLALRALTLGFEITELVNDLDIVRITTLAKQIYAALDDEVRKHILLAFSYHQQKLFLQRRPIAPSFHQNELRPLPKPFIHTTTSD